MPKLILELQRDAMDGGQTATDLLRKALVVARKLGITEFQDWVTHELNGYPPETEIPDYREVVGEVKAWNPRNGWIPVFIEDTNLAKVCSRRHLGQSIGTIEALVRDNGTQTLHAPFPPDMEADFMKNMGKPFKPTLHVGANQASGILEAVKNTILNWALDLESRGVLGEDMSFTVQEKQAADEIRTVNIQNFQGVLGDVQNSSITQNLNMSIVKGDFDSLRNYLLSVGVDSSDINKLGSSVEADPQPENKGQLGPEVSSWIGRMVSKAASGAWQIAVGAAGSLLAKAIGLYYGFI